MDRSNLEKVTSWKILWKKTQQSRQITEEWNVFYSFAKWHEVFFWHSFKVVVYSTKIFPKTLNCGIKNEKKLHKFVWKNGTSWVEIFCCSIRTKCWVRQKIFEKKKILVKPSLWNKKFTQNNNVNIEKSVNQYVCFKSRQGMLWSSI